MLDQVVRAAATRFGDRPFLIRGEEELTYLELDQRSDQVARAWHHRGLGQGAVVAITRRSDAGYLVAVAAASKLGAIVAGVNPSLTDPERAPLLDLVGASLVIDDDDLATRLGGALPDLAIDPHRVSTIVFTSGTTGRPKAAWFTNAQLDAIRRIDLGPRAEDWDGGGPMLASTQFAHIGVSTKLSWYLRSGATMVRVDPWRADAVWDAVASRRITTIGGVAPQLALLLRSPRLEEVDLSCVTSIVMGGALSSPALVEEARTRLAAGYSIRYSSTESGGVGLTTDPGADDDEVLHTIGRPRPGVKARIVDPATGVECCTDQVGELCLRSAAQMVGYWANPEATSQAIRDGWLHTGDLAVRDSQGRYRLAGRISEQYVRGGYNVAPAEVEAVLATHPKVAQVGVAARLDDVMGEIGVAVVVPRDPAHPPTLEELRDGAKDRLASWKLPEALVIIAEIPLTSMHKVDRATLSSLAR